MIITKAKYIEETLNWVSLTFDNGATGQTSVTDGIRRQHTDMLDEYLASGGVIEPQYSQAELDQINADKAYQEWKTQRNNAVVNIEVTYNGVIYQGDEDSQSRLSRAILALSDDTTTTPWVAKYNSIHQLNRVDLSAILTLGGAEQSRLWNLGRP